MRERQAIVAYVESQAKEAVLHAERAASELVGPARHEIWDVHCTASRWWVISNPTNLYSQLDFKSRDVALTFHVGLTLRVHYAEERQVPVRPENASLLPGSWRRWEQAFEAYDSGDEAENFQAVGVRLRECLVSFVMEVRNDEIVPPGDTPPKASDFKAWTELLANFLAPGEGSTKLRAYLKKQAIETWDYVNWLTHAKNAMRLDAEIGLQIVQHLLSLFTAARMRHSASTLRCGACGSYRVVTGVCSHCSWADPTYVEPATRDLTEEEISRRLATPCIPSSDISTFISPDDLLHG